MKNIEKLYNAMYSEKITPQNLVQNIFLENYKEIKFIKEDKMVICEAHCQPNGADSVIYKYSFELDKLMKLERLEKDHITILYDRMSIIEKLKAKMIINQAKQA